MVNILGGAIAKGPQKLCGASNGGASIAFWKNRGPQLSSPFPFSTALVSFMKVVGKIKVSCF